MTSQQTCCLLAMGSLLLTLAGPSRCAAQGPAAPAPPGAACTADPALPSFEVAAVTPVVGAKDHGPVSMGAYGHPQITMKNMPLNLLINISFGIQSEYFINPPHGLEDRLFDVQVKSADNLPLTYELFKPRLQRLLEERFCLKAHTGSKLVQGYALVAAKGGARMPAPSTSKEQGYGYITPRELFGANVDLRFLAGVLASPVGRPVEDQTGLQGNYTFKIQYAEPGDTESGLPSIFTALKEQLGLDLKPAQVSVQTLTIDHINLTPTEN